MPAGNICGLAAACLSFDAAVAGAARAQWAALPDDGREKLLAFADRAGLTLHLWRVARAAGPAEQLPDAAAYRERLGKNRVRLEKRRGETAELIARFREAGLRVAVLKGFTLEPDFVPCAGDRVQYDLDFLLSPVDARTAYRMLLDCRYEPLAGAAGGRGRPLDYLPALGRGRPLDHLPALGRKTGWEWRGDFFDIEIPAAVELHFQLWEAEFERIRVDLPGDPLERLVERAGFPVLHLHDQLSSCALHVMRHLFRGSLRLSHLYEIAWFLDSRAAERGFWQEWRAEAGAPLRRLCAAAFLLAARVFRCRLAPEVATDFELLPARARKWIERHWAAVLQTGPRDKPEVLLQLSFVESKRDGLLVLRRRLLPLSLPDPVDAVHLPAASLSLRRRVLRAARQTRFVVSRAAVHGRALPGLVRAAWEWWRP